MEIEKLLLQPESKILEFKRDLSSLTPIVKTIVAFANTAGGTIIIGRAPDGTLVGVSDIFKAEERIANAIADTIHPRILPEIEITTLNGKDLLIVKIAHWKGPFYIKSEGTPNGVYIRLGSTSRPAGPELLEELKRSSTYRYFDEQPILDLTTESLDLEKAKLLFRQAGRGELNEQKLLSFNVLVRSPQGFVPSIGGLLLFGKEQERMHFLPDARVSCARFRGSDKVNIIDRYEVQGTLLDAVQAVSQFIARNTRLAARFGGMQREDIPEYSPMAIREGLINAFAHSDYSLTGLHIQVAIFDDRLEIQNPGILPFGFTFEDFKAGVSRVRNRVIMRIFKELQLMEEWGSGYRRITEACRAGGYREPDWMEISTCIRMTFYPHSATALDEPGKLAALESTETKMHTKPLSKKAHVVLKAFNLAIPLEFREVMERLPEKIPERTLRYELARLRDLGYLILLGKGRAAVWMRSELSAQ